MSSPHPSAGEMLPLPRPIPPLTQRKRDGSPYLRHADIEEEIGRALATTPAAWNPGDLASECIVHLIRAKKGEPDKAVIGRLFEEITRRITRIATDNAKGFDQVSTEELVMKAGEEEIALGLAGTPSR